MTLHPRWERFLRACCYGSGDYHHQSREALARVLAEHDAERAGSTLPAEQPAATACCRLCGGDVIDIAEHRCPPPCSECGRPTGGCCTVAAQAAPDGVRLAERMREWPDAGKTTTPFTVRCWADEVAALGSKLAAAERERDVALRSAKYWKDEAGKAVANERSRCAEWAEFYWGKFSEAVKAIRDGKPAK